MREATRAAQEMLKALQKQLPHDAEQPTWQRIRKFLDARLVQHRDELERASEDRVIASLQGRIKEIRNLMATIEPPLPEVREKTEPEKYRSDADGLY